MRITNEHEHLRYIARLKKNPHQKHFAICVSPRRWQTLITQLNQAATAQRFTTEGWFKVTTNSACSIRMQHNSYTAHFRVDGTLPGTHDTSASWLAVTIRVNVAPDCISHQTNQMAIQNRGSENDRECATPSEQRPLLNVSLGNEKINGHKKEPARGE